MKNWKPRDVIALVMLLGCLILIGLGHNSLIVIILAAINGSYLGIDTIKKDK